MKQDKKKPLPEEPVPAPVPTPVTSKPEVSEPVVVTTPQETEPALVTEAREMLARAEAAGQTDLADAILAWLQSVEPLPYYRVTLDVTVQAKTATEAVAVARASSGGTWTARGVG